MASIVHPEWGQRKKKLRSQKDNPALGAGVA